MTETRGGTPVDYADDSIFPAGDSVSPGVKEATFADFKDYILASLAASGAPVQTEAADYTLDPGDAGHYIRMTDATTKVVNIATEATTALPDDGEWNIRNAGAGDLTITPAGGVTVNLPAGGTLVLETGMTVTLKRVAADVFDLLGQTVPV